jgi:hypothetical protein
VETELSAYQTVRDRWDSGGVVVLDGGIGSEVERLGFPRDRNISDLWGIRAVYERPELVREVHRRYAEAGADVLTAATWRADSLPEAERGGLVVGPPGRWREIFRLSVDLVREGAAEAGRADVPVAFAMWLESTAPEDVPELAEAVAAAAPDLVLVETMETIPPELEFPGYETLLETGLPLWVAYCWTPRGPSDTRKVGIEPYAGV